MSSRIGFILLAGVLLLSQAAGGPAPQCVPGEVVIRTAVAPSLSIVGQSKPSIAGSAGASDTLGRALQAMNVREVRPVGPTATAGKGRYAVGGTVEPTRSLYVCRFDPARAISELVAEVKALPGVIAAEPNYIGTLAAAPSDPLYVETADHFARIGMEAAWDVQPGAPSSLLVAVLDSGVDPYHEDLVNILSPDSYNFVDFNSNVFDDLGHGTRVAGILAAEGNNGAGIAGVAYGSTVLSCDVVDSQGLLTTANVIAALDYATGKGAKVINMSFQFSAKSQMLEDACNTAAQHAVLVASVGNRNQGDRPVYPASYDSVIGVGATELDSYARAPFSNYNGTETSLVDLVAPGVNIFTCIPGSAYDGIYTSGTSFAAPMVSGAAALLEAKYPSQSPKGIVNHLTNTAIPIGSWAGRGLLDGAAALANPLLPQLSVVSAVVDDATDYAVGNNGDGRWQKGETVALRLELVLDGRDVTAIAGVLSTTDAYVLSIGDENGAWNSINSGGQQLQGDPFSAIALAPDSPAHAVPLTLSLAPAGFPEQTLAFTVQAESVYTPPTIIASDTAWTADKTYLIASHTVVMPSATLTIEPGTTLLFEPGQSHTLEVRGAIRALGQEENEITFTSTRPFNGDVERGITLSGHGGGTRAIVSSVAFSPDGTRVLTGSDDNTARLWDATNGAQIRVFSGHGADVNSVAFSPDGTRVLTGGDGDTATLWDATTGAEIRTFIGHDGDVSSVAFSPDGTLVLTGSHDGTAKLWNAATGSELRSFSGHSAAVSSVAFSPDGTEVLTGSSDHTAKLWNAASGSEVRTYTGHTDALLSVQFSPDGSRVLTAGADGTALLREENTGNALRSFTGTRAVFSPDGTMILTGYDNTASLWDAATGEEIGSVFELAGGVRAVAFAPDGRHVAEGDARGVAELADVALVNLTLSLHGGLWIRDTATAAEFAHCNFRFGPVQDDSAGGLYEDCVFERTGGSASLMSEYVLPTQSARTFTHTGQVRAVAFSPDGTEVLTGASDSVKLWDAASGAEIRTFTGHTNGTNSVAFSPDGTQFLSGGYDNTARLWDVESGNEVRTFSGHGDYVFSVAFSPDGNQVLTGSFDDTAKLWNTATGTEIRTFVGNGGNVNAVAFSPDGGAVLTGNDDATVKLWNANTGAEIRTFSGHTNSILSVAFSPDGSEVITGSFDHTAKVWDTETGAELASFEHGQDVFAAVFSPDGETVLTTGSESSGDMVEWWDRQTGALLHSFPGHTNDVLAGAFSPDGKSILTGSADNTAKLWNISGALEPRIARCSVFENMVGDGIRAGDGLVEDCSATTIRHVGIKAGTLINCRAASSGDMGLWSVLAEGCTAKDGGQTGLFATGGAVGCTALDNQGAGIASGGSVQNCTAERNAMGIQAAEVSGCVARDNAGEGIITDATAVDCRAEGNGGAGIRSYAFDSSVLRCVVERNGEGLSIGGGAELSTIAANQGAGVTGGAIVSCAVHDNLGDGLASPVSVSNSWVVGNHGAGITGRGVPYTPIQNSAIRENTGAGVVSSGAMHGSSLFRNGTYDYLETRPSTELGQVDLSGNYWGDTTPLMDAHPWGSYFNIPAVFDFLDDLSLCEVKYADHLSSYARPDASAPAFLLTATPNLANAVNVGLATFTLVFSEAMDTSVEPVVTFGLEPPYSDRVVASLGWQSSRRWMGVYAMGIQTGDGINTLRVSQAKAADGFVIPDDTYHQFYVETWTGSGTGVSNGVASPLSESSMYLLWNASLDSSVAGYIILRSLSANGPYEQVDTVSSTVHEYTDGSLSPGTRYYYQIMEFDGNFNSRELTAPFNNVTLVPTPTPTPTATDTPTATFTATNTPTATFTWTPTHTLTYTPTNTFTLVPTPTFTSTWTPTNTPTATYTDTPTDTATWTPTPSFTSTFTGTPTDTATVTATPSSTSTSTGTPTNTATATPTPSWTATVTPTVTIPPSVFDLNGDGEVGREDALILAGYMQDGDMAGDLNGDQQVDCFDLFVLALHWGEVVSE